VVAAIDLLLTIGYIDGRLHEGEAALIHKYKDQLVALTPGSADKVDAEYKKLDTEIAAIAAEVVATDDAQYVNTKLKIRAVSIFRSFTPADQKVALELVAAVMRADGQETPTERAIHEELLAFFHANRQLPAPVVPPPPDLMRVATAQRMELASSSHPALDPIEQNYSSDPATLHAQFGSEYNLIFGAINTWEQQRALGNGRLLGITHIEQLAPGTQILDGHVHVLKPNRPTELIVLGDLHGCYTCLKAALLQSRFLEKAAATQQDPSLPDVKLVLLGDYLDRGRFGFEGVLRAALQLVALYPQNVILLRGNHEYLVRVNDRIMSAVNPAEAVPSIADRAPPGILDAYRHVFEHMPTSLLFERILLVHGGIPRDDTMAHRYRDLSSFDDAVIRFEMMWSDPEQIDFVPLELQRATPRFSFGREQFRAFMDRIGCHTMIRGHEAIETGFQTTFDLGHCKLHTLFSAGGRDNPDLPADSRYRNVTPTALTIRWENGLSTATPWTIDYAPFATGAHNGLYR